MQNFIKAIVLTASLALPAFFASNAFAIPSCGVNCTSATKNPHGYTPATPTNCYSCHANNATGGTAGGGTSSGGSTSGTLTVKTTKESCGACAVGTAPKSVGAHKNVTATTLCSICHVSTSTGGTGGTGGSTGGTVGIYPTKHGCGACVVGTAPGSVSAHKNVNANKTACSVCHMPSATGGSGNHTDNDHGTTGNTGGRHDDDHHQTSPGNSDFGHSHQHDKRSQDSRRDHDD